MKRHEEGITLIALIVTIVILIILTAITISNVMGSNLFGLAKGAAENYVEAGKEEEKAIDKMIGIMQGWQVGDDSKIQPGDVVNITEKDNYTDVDGRTATVPAGFKVSTKSSEQRIKDGLVIQDEQGNEFVWVPCYYGETKPDGTADDVQEYKSHTYAGTATKNNDQSDSTVDKGEGNWKTNCYTAYGQNWKDDAATTYGKTSVTNYGGFYIGRYEAGWEDTMTELASNNTAYITSYTDEETKKNVNNKKPVSKANTFSWNFISQQNAKLVSEAMYNNVTYNDGAKYIDSVQSKLVDGTAWDTVTNWIGTTGVDVTKSETYGNYSNTNKQYNGWYAEHVYGGQKSGKTGGNMGWMYARNFTKGLILLNSVRLSNNGQWETKKEKYTDTTNATIEQNLLDTRIEIPTGSYEDFKLKNIYDLAGNVWEWTTEVGDHKEDNSPVTNEGSFAVLRGGSFSYTGIKDPLCIRAGKNSSSTLMTVHIGFRVVLYVK